MPFREIRAFLVAVATLCVVTPTPVPAEIAVSAGLTDTADTWGPVEVGVESRLQNIVLWGGQVWSLTPAFGLTANLDSAFYGYGGFRFNLLPTERVQITIHTAAGYYEEGDGKDLGGPVEFRSGLDLGWRLRNQRQIGLSFFHLSNADLYDENPGINSLVLFYQF